MDADVKSGESEERVNGRTLTLDGLRSMKKLYNFLVSRSFTDTEMSSCRRNVSLLLAVRDSTENLVRAAMGSEDCDTPSR